MPGKDNFEDANNRNEKEEKQKEIQFHTFRVH
jgi:hypothetical protein